MCLSIIKDFFLKVIISYNFHIIYNHKQCTRYIYFLQILIKESNVAAKTHIIFLITYSYKLSN